MRHRKTKKAATLRRHARRRADTRYGLDLSRKELDEIVRAIQHNEGEFIEKQSLTRTLWLVNVKGQPCRVVYDRKRKAVVTFLPLEDGHDLDASEAHQ